MKGTVRNGHLANLAQNSRLVVSRLAPSRRDDFPYLSIPALMSGGSTPVFWAFRAHQRNFGDELAPLLINWLSQKPVRWNNLGSKCLVGGGSTLEWLSDRRMRASIKSPVVVWSAGFMHRGSKLDAERANASVVSVRGPMSREQLSGADTAPSYGDLGLLVSRFLGWQTSLTDRSRILVIPHYVDEESDFLHELQRRWKDVEVLRVSNSPFDLCSAIASASFLVSSALHPLIVADSFRIPNVWIRLSDRVGGGSFKFEDYLSAHDIAANPLSPSNFFANVDKELANYDRPRLSKLQDDVQDSLERALSLLAAQNAGSTKFRD